MCRVRFPVPVKRELFGIKFGNQVHHRRQDNSLAAVSAMIMISGVDFRNDALRRPPLYSLRRDEADLGHGSQRGFFVTRDAGPDNSIEGIEIGIVGRSHCSIISRRRTHSHAADRAAGRARPAGREPAPTSAAVPGLPPRQQLHCPAGHHHDGGPGQSSERSPHPSTEATHHAAHRSTGVRSLHCGRWHGFDPRRTGSGRSDNPKSLGASRPIPRRGARRGEAVAVNRAGVGGYDTPAVVVVVDPGTGVTQPCRE